MNARERKKCCAVAQDVLDHLKLLNVARGTYCEGKFPDGVRDSKEQAKKYIDVISKDCKVCAIGACFLSYVRLYNNVTLGQLVGGYDTIKDDFFDVEYYNIDHELAKVFSQRQLCLIETAFECGYIHFRVDDEDYKDLCHDSNEFSAAISFGEKYSVPKKRLMAIVKNIIKNNGEFIPNKQLYNRLHGNKGKKIAVEIL